MKEDQRGICHWPEAAKDFLKREEKKRASREGQEGKSKARIGRESCGESPKVTVKKTRKGNAGTNPQIERKK